MSGEIKINASIRNAKGSSSVRRLRTSGTVPAIMYGIENDPQMLEIDTHSFVQLLRHHASEYLVIDLEIEGAGNKKVLVKEVQHHPVTGNVLHVDFQEISLTDKIRVELPVELVGEAEGVTQQGGVMEHLLRMVEIECLPSDIIEMIEVDVSAMKIGDRITVGDIVLDKNKFTVVTAPEVAIASVMVPRIQAAGGEAEAETAVAAEAEAAK